LQIYDTAHEKKHERFKKVYFDLLPKRSKDDPASEDYSALAEHRHVTQALQLQHTMLLQIRLKQKRPPVKFLGGYSTKILAYRKHLRLKSYRISQYDDSDSFFAV
jgi:hypothetical protein